MLTLNCVCANNDFAAADPYATTLQRGKAGIVSVEQLPPLNKNLEMGSGKFGVLYSDPRDPLRCIKKLKTPLRGREAESLNRLVDLTRWARPSDVHHLLTRFAWPIEIFGDIREVHAFTMPKAPQSCYFDVTIVSRLADRSRPGSFTETKKSRRDPLQLKFLIDDSWWQGRQISSRKPEVDIEGRIDIAIDCCDSVFVLHSHGLVYGDISANNVVARRDAFPGAYFFDADSISSVEFRAAEPLVSPGWETPGGLDPMAIDRSRCALVVLRLLTEQPNARPDDHPSMLGSNFVITSLLPILQECYQRGTESSFVELIRTLRSLRSVPHGDEVIDDALRTGYARVVLREQVHARTSSHHILMEQAKTQILFEEQVDQAIGLEHRRLVRRSKVRVGQFKLDVSPRFELLRDLTSDSELMELIYEAQFQEIVNHLVASGLGNLEGHPSILRVVEHAHLEVDLPTPTIFVQPGKAQVEVAWPKEEFANTARLRIQTGNDKQDFVVERQRGDQQISRIVAAPRGADLRVSVVFGTRSKSGTDYFPSFGRTLNSVIPAVPAPQRPAVSASPARNMPLIQPDLDVVIIDPDAEQREQERLERERQARVRRRLLIGAGAIVAAILGVVGYIVLRPPSEYIALKDAQVAAAPSDWGQSSFGPELVTVEKTSLSVTFSWPERIIDWRYRFQHSYNGFDWSRPTTIDSSEGLRSLELDFSDNGSPPLHLVEILDSDGDVRARQFVNVLHETGFATYPAFSKTGNEIDIEMSPTGLAGERRPVAFHVEGLTRVESGETPIVSRRVDSTNTSISQPSNGVLSSVRVRAIFGPGDFGIWIGIAL